MTPVNKPIEHVAHSEGLIALVFLVFAIIASAWYLKQLRLMPSDMKMLDMSYKELFLMALQIVRHVVNGTKVGVDLGLPKNDSYKGTLRSSSSTKNESGVPLTNHRTEFNQSLEIPVVVNGQNGSEKVTVKFSVSCSPLGFAYAKEMHAGSIAAIDAWFAEHVYKGYEPTTLPAFTDLIDPDGPAAT